MQKCAGTREASARRNFAAARAAPDALGRREESELLIALAPHLEDWLARMFGVEPEVNALQAAQHELAPLFACKRQVVQRKAMNKYKADQAASFDGAALRDIVRQAQGRVIVTSFASHIHRIQQVIDAAVQMHGGAGVTKGVKVEELYRDIRALRIYEGASEVQRQIIARDLLKEFGR